ncbi:hypothetical protein LguiA_008264 [Lonicera macranthoides]
MDKFLIKRKRVVKQCCSQPEVQSSSNTGSNNVQARSSTQLEVKSCKNAVFNREEVNVDELEFDLALSSNVNDYDPKQIEVGLCNHSEQTRLDYRIRLTASFDCLKYLLRQGLAFRGYGEFEGSNNSGNFLELLHLLAEQNDSIYQVLKNAPKNHNMTSPDIQKDLINAAASVTIKAIMREIGDELFTILVDESHDISFKEQMVVILRYVDKSGCVVERFVGMVQVHDNFALSLKVAIDSFFSKHGLSVSSLRGQGYDGASNMRGEFNCLKTLILNENKSAFYVHCFAHQLQLTLVAVSKKNTRVGSFFYHVGVLSNIVGASCKRRDLLCEKQFEAIIEWIYSGERETGICLNQETTLKRVGHTCLGSHFGTLCGLIDLFSSVIDMLEVIEDEGLYDGQRAQAEDLKLHLQTFEFVFILHMMKIILGITNDLSQALQRRDQDLINAMTYVQVSKRRLQKMKDDGWESFFDIVSSFCTKHGVGIPNMGDLFVVHGRSRRNAEEKTNLHYYRVELFYAAIDLQLQELNDRFDKLNTELLLCMACFDPTNSFYHFQLKKLLRFANFYPNDFSPVDLVLLEDQLKDYIKDVRSDDDFYNLTGIGALAQKMVESGKHIDYPLVFFLMKLALLLPVATASVERTFSAMKIIKNAVRNRVGDEYMNDCLVTYIEQDIFNEIKKEDVLQYFQKMKPRRMLL